MSHVSNLDVAVSSFWQLARHWNQGHKAKLELSCENGSLHMQLSAVLGHPDQPHFPHPPPQHHPPSSPPPKKKKSPSQLRRQERRKQEAIGKAEEAGTSKTVFEETDNVFSEKVSNQVVSEAEIENTSVIIVDDSVDKTSLTFKCDQCAYTNSTEKGLGQHTRMKHRISQLDGNFDLLEEDSESINTVSVKYRISVQEKKSVKEVTKELEKTELWDNIKLSHFDVKEELGIFIVEVDCVRRDYPKEFNVPWAVSLLTSLPWPRGYSVISSQPPNYLREG